MIDININANKNLEWLIWNGLKGSPTSNEPKVFAIMVEPATTAEASTIKKTDIKTCFLSKCNIQKTIIGITCYWHLEQQLYNIQRV